MEFDNLSIPGATVCPLCENEEVELRENKAERPYFQCETFGTVVNLRPSEGDTGAVETLRELQQRATDDDAETLESPEDDSETAETDESDDSTTASDLFGE